MTLQEEKRILRVQAGDGDALADLIDEHYARVYAYCFRHCGDRELAQDLTQDAFVKMLAGIDRYNHYGKFLNYMYVIAGNLYKDWLKKKRPDYREHLPEAGQVDADLADAILVRAAVGSLPFAERNAIILRYYHDCKVEEIARITKSSVPMTKYRLRQASSKLKRMLKEE